MGEKKYLVDINMSGNKIKGVATPSSGTDAANKTYVDTHSGALPSKTIIMWFGTKSGIPSGWVLCNGANGTPNLVNKMPFGIDSDASKGLGHGSNNAVTISHYHKIDHNHPLSGTSSNGAHVHSVPYRYNTVQENAKNGTPNRYLLHQAGGTSSYTAAEAGGHSHTFDVPNFTGFSDTRGSSGTDRNIPAVTNVFFIMKL